MTSGCRRGDLAYAFHELTFALLYLVIVAILFQRGMRWTWWAGWTVEIANLAYLFTFGTHDTTIFARALVAVVALPILLLASAPWFFERYRVSAGA